MNSASLTVTTLVVGGSAGGREAAIAAALVPGLASAAILEGLSDGNSALADLAELTKGGAAPAVQVMRIAPGCLCCAGNVILRVTLNRLLRHPPEQLFISLADASHLETLRLWLSSAPYDQLLDLGADIAVA
ncbi:MAG TPA: GTPase [Janthinobacterium sp.]|nr:GTPase [Janthinobacterium sp.]